MPAAGVVGVMLAESAKAAPVGLGASAAGVSGGASVAAGGIAKGAAVMMKIAMMKMVAVVVVCIVLILGAGTVVIVKQMARAETAPVAATAESKLTAVAGSGPAKTLAEKLWDIELLKDGKDTLFQEVEAMARPLLKEYPAPEDQGKIYYQIALIYAQSGPVYDATIRNVKAALDLPLDGAKRLQLFAYWGDAIQIEHAGARGNDLMLARKEAAKIYLRGLKEYVDKKIPKDKPVLPTWSVVNSDGPETDESRRLKSEIDAKIAAKNVALFQIAMIEQRDSLVKQLVYMYSRFPFATDELAVLNKETLGDNWLVGELVDKTNAEIKKRVEAASPIR